MAALTITNLQTSSNNGNSGITSFSTASLTPAPNQAMLVAMASRVASGTPNVPTPSLSGWVFSQINTVTFGTSRITLFTAIGTGTGAILFDFAGQGQQIFSWSVVQVGNGKKSGTGGSAVAVQSATFSSGSASSYTISLGAFANVNNGVFSCVAKDATNDVVPQSGYTELGEAPVSSPNWDIESMWRPDNNLNPHATFTGSGGDSVGAIAIEVAFLAPFLGGAII